LKIKILFLGASKRVSLLERFIYAAKDLDLKIEIISCEKDDYFFPISHMAKILKGPKFEEGEEFDNWLISVIVSHKIDIVIPNMDSATVALSAFKEKYQSKYKTWFLVSDYKICNAMNNKILADKVFSDNKLLVPINSINVFPKIAKPAKGFGAKGIINIQNEEELDIFNKKYNPDEFIVQNFISGQETTVDMYVSKANKLIGYVLRDRLEVSDGEVMVCKTREPDDNEKKLIENIYRIGGWEGCITIQYIKDTAGKLYLLEINPRFGGGATCSIETGLNMPKYILSELLGHKLIIPQKIRHVFMTRARRDYYKNI
jgi:carbamoyl-phosphate synthase large subunit